MNKLTVTQVALGSLARAKGRNRSMAIGAGLAIFFVSALFLATQSIDHTYRLNHVGRVGGQDAILRDGESIAPQDLLDSGLVSRVGNVYVIGETVDGRCPIGHYDEVGAAMAARQLIAGRMPQGPGELAVEPGFLQKKRTDAQVGDDLDVDIRVPLGARGQFLPDPVRKTYHIVGLLKPQSIHLAGHTTTDFAYLPYPSAIAWAGEQVEAGGRAVVHRMVSLAPGATFAQLEAFLPDEQHPLSTAFHLFSPDIRAAQDNYTGQVMLVVACVLGAVLVLAACLGIVNAFTASLTARRAQIGMMRAVGATSRQIRQVFGREALVMALAVSPASIALSYLLAWGGAQWMGIAFYANPWFLPADLVASLAVVALAAWIPLRSASAMPPMQAIRDVPLMRAKGRVHVKGRQRYDAPALIAGRHLALYRTRRAGTCAMVAVSMLLITMALPLALRVRVRQGAHAYVISKQWFDNQFIESNVAPHEGLTDGDIQEMAALPMVSQADAVAQAQVLVLTHRATPYAVGGASYWQAPPEEYRAMQAHLNTAKDLVPIKLYALDEGVVAALAPTVLSGDIDLGALNAGKQVLVMAPPAYYKREMHEVDAHGESYTYFMTQSTPFSDMTGVTTYTNDAYFAGDDLSIAHLFTRSDPPDLVGDIDFAAVETQLAQATIGAVLGEGAIDALGDLTLGGIFSDEQVLITTRAGMAALGMETAGYLCAGVRLSGAPDEATRAYLTDALKGIAARGNGMELTDNLQRAQDDAFTQGLLAMCLLAVLLLMLSMCVSLVSSAITGRVRSEKRAIGTLRAVGAPLHDIVRSYRLQALWMLAWGVAAGLAASAAYALWQLISRGGIDLAIGPVALAQALFLGAVALICGVNLRVRVGEIARASIVSNIREL